MVFEYEYMSNIQERLCCIIAQSKNNVIGVNGDLPWKIKEDLKHFQRVTENTIVIMGRKTYESLPVKKLKNRINIVLTSQENYYENEKDLYFCTLNECIKLCEEKKEYTIFVIGGEEIYKKFLGLYQKMYVTKVNKEITGDTKSPFTDAYLEQNYKLVSKSEEKIQDDLSYHFYSYEKKS